MKTARLSADGDADPTMRRRGGYRHKPGPSSALSDGPVDADYVIQRLEEAGATLLALPGTGWSTRLKRSSIDIVRTALDAYGWETARIRPAVPPADKIDRMDDALGWISLIPEDQYVLRRIVGARNSCIRFRTVTCFRGAASALLSARTIKPCSGGTRAASPSSWRHCTASADFSLARSFIDRSCRRRRTATLAGQADQGTKRGNRSCSAAPFSPPRPSRHSP